MEHLYFDIPLDSSFNERSKDIRGRMNKKGASAWEHEQGAKAICGLSKSICSTSNE
jgi:hypothetical protein